MPKPDQILRLPHDNEALVLRSSMPLAALSFLEPLYIYIEVIGNLQIECAFK